MLNEESETEKMEKEKFEKLEKILKISRKTAILCKTEEQAKELYNIFNSLDLVKKDGTKYNPMITNWHYHKEETCYYPFSGWRTDISMAKYSNYDIITAEDFITIHKV